MTWRQLWQWVKMWSDDKYCIAFPEQAKEWLRWCGGYVTSCQRFLSHRKLWFKNDTTCLLPNDSNTTHVRIFVWPLFSTSLQLCHVICITSSVQSKITIYTCCKLQCLGPRASSLADDTSPRPDLKSTVLAARSTTNLVSLHSRAQLFDWQRWNWQKWMRRSVAL